jgi:Raf kinase inhibitor-like YbhB/YbcL family protein
MKKFPFIFILLIFLAACAPQSTSTPEAPLRATDVLPTTESFRAATEPPPIAGQPAGDFTLTSERFVEGQPIPEKYTCTDQNVSPALAWTNPPRGVETFALIMDDPDAPGGTWTHWVLYNIPAATRSLPDVLPGQGGIAYIGSHGMNTAGNTYYEGPCPPLGTHRYFFKLFALDTALDFASSPDAAELTAAMEGHILAETELMGTYAK